MPVLYRKWRPQRLDQVVGQEHVTQTLRQAVAQGRLAHAYLFAGPRGTGKTSTARVLAKAVNCQAPQGGEPCNACPFCRAVESGNSLFLLELDAASNRGIEDVRNIREKVFTAGQGEGRYKVYVLDEAHMLTEAAFNALLKTLEEPPPYIIFILCTTDPQKMPPTIISRCQRFDFHRLSQPQVMGRLEEIARTEGYAVEPEAMHLLARAAEGSLRDGCNLLEQMVTSYGQRVALAQVQEALGVREDTRARELVRHALGGETPKGMAVLLEVARGGGDLKAFQRDVLAYLQGVLRCKAGASGGLDYPAETVVELQGIAASVPWERLARALKVFGNLPLRTDSYSWLPLELALVEVAQAPQVPDPGEAPPQTRPPSTPPPAPERRPAGGGAPPPRAPARPQGAPPPPVAKAADTPMTEAAPSAGPAVGAPGAADDQWAKLRRLLRGVRGKKGLDVGALLNSCSDHYLENDQLVVVYKSRSNMERLEEELEDPLCRQKLLEAVHEAFGAQYTLRLAVGEGEGDQRKSRGHLVRSAIALGARVVEQKEAQE
ncbi:MAG: DNA polymerase III subunit gamma/tau [Chloroflexi bacterium]|nr:DNA polymerase III subunit gamma/tau [Chloroflexota bacterium]